jgi:hypothetical protein
MQNVEKLAKQMENTDDIWPAIPFSAWQATCDTLHMWVQIVGKIRALKAPKLNHCWHVTLYVTSRGLTTSPIPDRDRTFQIDFDFIAHQLTIAVSNGETERFALTPRSVASFYEEVMGRLRKLGIDAKINTMPAEVPNAIPCDKDQTHASYDAAAVSRFWRALVTIDQIFHEFRAGFIGKASPVHFFWGSFDLAVTRFSGRRAPKHPSSPMLPDSIMQDAYSHEEYSCGFWPGNGGFGQAAFYAYAYPEPPGFSAAPALPKGASYNKELGEFILPYDAVRASADPKAVVMDFLHSTYDAAADLGTWDRAELEKR